MPVIRGRVRVSAVTAEERERVARQLADELNGASAPGGPVIFEMPLEGQDRFDVVVVWDVWGPFTSTDRSDLILEAYQSRQSQVALALGVTYQEAIEQSVLPYEVEPLARRGELDQDEAKRAMFAEGGFTLGDGRGRLRFPALSLAEEAHMRLADAFPQGCWVIAQNG